MSHKKRNNNLNETNVKYIKSENISLVTGGQVRQFYADEDRDSYKVERSRLFRNNPSPQHHYRYMPESRGDHKKAKSKKSTFCGLNLKSKSKKLISYCLIYVLMFTCAITLLYLFYTPKQMNLFGFYTNNNLRLKFYRFVLGTNGSITTITPKIITTTEPTIFITQSTIHPPTSSTKKKQQTTTPPMKVASTTTMRPKITTEMNIRTSVESDILSTTLAPEDSEEVVRDEKKSENKIKSLTTCLTINVTATTEASASTSSTSVSSISASTIKSKIVEVLKKGSTSSTTAVPTTLLPKDNSTETLEFNEKFSYSNTQLSNMDKNETNYDETIVDNGILPTEDEEEERRKDEIESNKKIASFFGVDPVTGKEKDDNKGGFLASRQIANSKSFDLEDSDQAKFGGLPSSDQKQTNNNKWFLSGAQQFGRNNFSPTKSPKEDEFKYHPMLKLLYRNCYGGCRT